MSVRELFIDMLMLGGVGFVAYGAWLIYEPAGFIVLGLSAIGGAAMLVRA